MGPCDRSKEKVSQLTTAPGDRAGGRVSLAAPTAKSGPPPDNAPKPTAWWTDYLLRASVFSTCVTTAPGSTGNACASLQRRRQRRTDLRHVLDHAVLPGAVPAVGVHGRDPAQGGA